MPKQDDLKLMAHLMRRAGFGVTRDELEARVAKGYEATVEELVDPEAAGVPPTESYILYRYYPGAHLPPAEPPTSQVYWLYHLINAERVLENKMSLFWHHIFCTGDAKVDNWNEVRLQIEMFRRHGLGNYGTLLLELARNPAMLFFLDNNDNHAQAVNENWGRELLELFSLGVGNYTEDDVRESSRAFTGWTMAPRIPRYPYGRFKWEFEFRPEDHDEGEKTFLGHAGNFNGEDIIDIVLEQPACPRFIARHLYNFFVADELQVPAWSITEPRDPDAVYLLAKTLKESNYELKPVLRTLFNSDFFKAEAGKLNKVKSPTELVVGTLRLVGGYGLPGPDFAWLAMQPSYMGQYLLNPPGVEGWHTGQEWINSGALMTRINFAAEQVADVSRPGVQSIIERLRSHGSISSEEFVDQCLDLIGPIEVPPETRHELVAHAQAGNGGMLDWDTEEEAHASAERVGEMLQLIVATREYQFA